MSAGVCGRMILFGCSGCNWPFSGGCVPLLKPGGSLVYSTCSLEKEENEKVIEAFLEEKRDFRLTKSEKRLPFRDSIDGAFAARLERM